MRRIAVAGEALAQRFSLGGQMAALLGIQGRDREIVAMKQREAVADLLEAVETATREVGPALPPDTRERLRAVKGLGPARVEEILRALGVEAEPADHAEPDAED